MKHTRITKNWGKLAYEETQSINRELLQVQSYKQNKQTQNLQQATSVLNETVLQTTVFATKQEVLQASLNLQLNVAQTFEVQLVLNNMTIFSQKVTGQTYSVVVPFFAFAQNELAIRLQSDSAILVNSASLQLIGKFEGVQKTYEEVSLDFKNDDSEIALLLKYNNEQNLYYFSNTAALKEFATATPTSVWENVICTGYYKEYQVTTVIDQELFLLQKDVTNQTIVLQNTLGSKSVVVSHNMDMQYTFVPVCDQNVRFVVFGLQNNTLTYYVYDKDLVLQYTSSKTMQFKTGIKQIVPVANKLQTASVQNTVLFVTMQNEVFALSFASNDTQTNLTFSHAPLFLTYASYVSAYTLQTGLVLMAQKTAQVQKTEYAFEETHFTYKKTSVTNIPNATLGFVCLHEPVFWVQQGFSDAPSTT